ncbi:NAD-dependent epimerase/dehydratase family protein [Paenibacillus oceani]|uniref:NAD-dependent epimerase/dehydratase family protein n=1 Tax=Paenibacillus oceani TaxID=2772510 RepID=A0A927GYC0_9BACL|nr:NAD-dependent epimerase/dehydratase family protein [Paenibacillus oceani]MBD2860882.1 NAD-dependent epimerase/dehydratase family protein [Paenibacillus oceani]
MKTALVTGAAGFLGSHLAVRLLAQGYQVIGIDNLSTGTKLNLSGLNGQERFRFLECNIAETDCLNLGELAGADEIYHLASAASPKFYQQFPFETIQANTTGTWNMLELARRAGAKLVYTSTSEAYGDPTVHPQPEEYRGNVNTWGPRACYDESKRLGEVYCYEYAHRYQVPVKVARIFNTYSAGLRNDDGRVISNFVYQAIRGDDITVYGDGLQTRSFCYVDDTVRALMLMMDRDQASGEIINVGNPVEYTVLDVAKLVQRLAGSTSAIVFRLLPQDDPKVRRPVIDKARRLLGWEPEVGLEGGLRKTIAACRRLLAQGGLP